MKSLMFSPKNYTAVHAVDLHVHYNAPDGTPLACELCAQAKKRPASLRCHRQFDQRTWWYDCLQCDFAGTGLDYLAAVDRVSPIQKLRELRRTGLVHDVSEEVIQAYQEALESAVALKEAYNECRRLPSARDSAQLQSLENLDHYFQLRRYRTGDRRTFERWFHPAATGPQTGACRLFRGRNWSRITAIPLYDMPLRMSAVLFVNGHAQGTHAIAIKRLGPQLGGVSTFEPGYLATSRIVPADGTEPVVLSTDWLRVLRLQSNIWYQERAVAPIVAWFPNDPVTGRNWMYRWTLFREIPKVFWSFPDDPVALREACLQNALVSHAYYQPGTRACLLPPGLLDGAVVRSVARDALSWDRALTLYLETDPHAMEARLSTLRLPYRILEDYLRSAPPSIRQIVSARFLASGDTTRYVDNALITGSQDGWHQAARNPHAPPILLSSARCIVDRVVRFGDRKPMYQGRVLIGNESHPFLEYESEIEKNAVAFVRNVCADHRSRTHPVVYASAEKLLKLIRAHANFQVTHIEAGFGWDDRTASLRLPNLTFSDQAVLDSGLNLASGPFATLHARHVGALTDVDRQVLAVYREETPYVLAVLVSLLPGLFAPAYRKEPPQTAVVGMNLDLLEPLFRMLNLPVSLKSMTATLDDHAATHRCPFLVKVPSQPIRTKRTDRLSWVDAVGLYGSVFVFSSITNVLSRMCYGGANMLLLPRQRFYRWLRGDLPDVYLKCFVGLLRHCSRYVLESCLTSRHWDADLIDEGYRYLESEERLSVRKGMIVDGYDEPSSYFCDYVLLRRDRGELEMTESENGVAIPVASLAESFRNDVGFFDFDLIRILLTEGMLLKSYDGNRHRFLLDPDPFTASRRRIEQIYVPYLRRKI